MKLAAVQLLLSYDERKEAVKILENLNDKDRSMPGIVSALVTLHLADNNREKASAVLKDAVNWYKKNKVIIFDKRNKIEKFRYSIFKKTVSFLFVFFKLGKYRGSRNFVASSSGLSFTRWRGQCCSCQPRSAASSFSFRY